MEKNMVATTTGHIGTTLTIHSFVPSYPKVSKCKRFEDFRLRDLSCKLFQ